MRLQYIVVCDIMVAMTNKPQDTTLQTNLLSLAETPAGFSASEVTGFAPDLVRRVANAMVAEGRMVRAKVGTRAMRYFINEAKANTFREGNVSRARHRPLVGMRAKARWSVEEPGLITSRTKITIAPPLPRRVFRTSTYQMF